MAKGPTGARVPDQTGDGVILSLPSGRCNPIGSLSQLPDQFVELFQILVVDDQCAALPSQWTFFAVIVVVTLLVVPPAARLGLTRGLSLTTASILIELSFITKVPKPCRISPKAKVAPSPRLRPPL